MHRVSIFQYVLFERSAVNLEVHTLNTHCSQWIWVVKKNLQFRNTNHNFNPFYGETKAYISPFLLPCSLRPLVSSLPCSKYNGVGKVKEKVKEKSFLLYSHNLFRRAGSLLLELCTVLYRTFESVSFCLSTSCSIIQNGIFKGHASLTLVDLK